ncbi:DUF2244 domain-containing protein [Accumulibacter sp.]|uniref:DUF2244 domain-containing protein n=1 Tax=Accumulibacter sp. TaxID=2053492 RepID=UPI001DF4B7F9|nr:DUF2244 domain-containing protein [Accumulibacter sp.]MCB1942055.1 DUF2244 domain-containing protein [Accumulibacter sp.]
MSLVAAQTPTVRTWLARPNSALSVAASNWVFAATAAFSGAIALTFSYFGAWPVLPFTGLDLALLWYALRHVQATANDFERITLEAERLTIETRRGARFERHEFHPYWARLHRPKSPAHAGHRLLIGSHGKLVEVGRLLTAEQRMTLGNELQKNLGAAWPDNPLRGA